MIQYRVLCLLNLGLGDQTTDNGKQHHASAITGDLGLVLFEVGCSLISSKTIQDSEPGSRLRAKLEGSAKKKN